MYASGRDNLGASVWTSQTYNLVYEQDVVYNQQVYECYGTMLPEEFCRGNGQIEVTFAQYTLNETDSVEQIVTSGTVNLYIDGVGNNNAGVAISPYDITASKVNALVKKVDILEKNDATVLSVQPIESLSATTVQEALEALEEKKVDKVQAEAGKLLLSNGKGGIEVTEIGIQEYQNQRTYIDIENEKQDTRMDSMQEEISANTKDRHKHRDLELLNSYTVPNDALLESVDKMHEHGNKEKLDAITEAFTTELKNNLEGAVSSIDFNEKEGIFTFTKNNGEKVIVDTLLEKVIVNFHYDSEKQALILESKDGEQQEIPIGALLSPYTGSDGQEIKVTVNRENEIEASIKAGAVTESKLGTDIVDKLSMIVPAREIVDLIYPIGIRVEFGEEFNPNTKWTWTEWERIEHGKFAKPVPEGQVGDTGGSETVSLTAENNGPHTHTQDGHNHGVTADRKYGGNASGNWDWVGWDNGDRGGRNNQTLYSDTRQPAIHNSGVGKPFSIMNPYEGVAKWQRTK